MRILLFSDIPPCDNYTAGIVLNRLCDFILDEGHGLCCYTVKHKDVTPSIPQNKLKRIRFKTMKMPAENWGLKWLGPVSSFIMNNLTASFRLPTIAKNVASFIKEQECDLIWGVIQGQATIRIIRQASKLAKIPYIVQAWILPNGGWMRISLTV